MASVKAKRFSAGYGARRVLRSLTFEVPKNTTIAIVGPGGSGKSSLLRAIGREAHEGFWTRGALRVPNGQIKLIPQRPRANGGSMTSAADIAESLASDADLHLLDEPEAGISEEQQARVAAELSSARGRRTIILVSHHLDLVRAVSDAMMLLVDGSLIEHDATSKLFAAPSNPRTRQFITLGS